MMKVLTIVLLVVMSIDQQQAANEPIPLPMYRMLREVWLNMFGRTIDEPRYHQAAKRENRLQRRLPDAAKFPCFNDKFKFEDGRSQQKPTSVHELRPGDIDVIGAMGDSLTAANGVAATTVLQVLTENRGVSWSIGGQGNWRQYLTLPNILKEFNPKLVGYSYNDALPFHRANQFNAAEFGALSQDFPYMAKELTRRIRNDPRVDFKNDWKLVTMWVGHNDFCLYACLGNSVSEIVEKHRRELHQTLKYLKENLPRTLVNLVPVADASKVKSLDPVPPTCFITLRFECPCFFGETNKNKHDMVKRVINEWQLVDRTMADLPEFSDSDTFAVVMQPWTLGVDYPQTSDGKIDMTYLSTDCFHFSQKAAARMANALWNNMMEPVGNKTQGWPKLYKTFLCPSKEHPFIYTKRNSGETNEIRR